MNSVQSLPAGPGGKVPEIKKETMIKAYDIWDMRPYPVIT